MRFHMMALTGAALLFATAAYADDPRFREAFLRVERARPERTNVDDADREDANVGPERSTDGGDPVNAT